MTATDGRKRVPIDQVGGQYDEFGQIIFEIDVVGDGGGFGFDVPMSAITAVRSPPVTADLSAQLRHAAIAGPINRAPCVASWPGAAAIDAR
ncbi:MAG: hypothetical protein NVSMB4_07520 [Acidimicrobiales bacterium]